MKSLPSLCALVLLASAARGAVTETITQTFPLAADGTVAVSDVNGSVTISAWDKDEVAVEAVKKAPDASDLARIHVKFEARPARVAIKTEYEKSGWLFGSTVRGEVHYTLRVPAGASLKRVDTVNAAITVHGVHGALDLRTVNGSIRASGARAAAVLDTVNGGITVEFDRLPADVPVEAKSVNGGVEVGLPADAGAWIEAHSVNGGLHCGLPLTLESTGRGTMRGTLGAGGARIEIHTVNGSVTIRKS